MPQRHIAHTASLSLSGSEVAAAAATSTSDSDRDADLAVCRMAWSVQDGVGHAEEDNARIWRTCEHP